MMAIDDERGEGGKKCSNLDDVICERPLKETEYQIEEKVYINHGSPIKHGGRGLVKSHKICFLVTHGG